MNKQNTKEKVVLLIHGDGGHRAKMKLLYTYINIDCSHLKYINICENEDCLEKANIKFNFPVIRDKYSRYKTILNMFTSTYQVLRLLFKIQKKYDVRVILSTGPGISILPSIFFKFSGTKIIHLETDSRFKTISLSGRILHHIADKFYVPNKSLLSLYKNSEYSGRL